MTGDLFSERYPPPERPWTHEYAETHRRLVVDVVNDKKLLECFASGAQLPAGYGVAFDERVIEFPWLFARGLTGRTLDAGSALNHEHVLDLALREVAELHVVTLEPEERAFPEKRVSYVYADLRDMPYRDGWFETTVCLSTLEHVGMDNTVYGVGGPRAEDPTREMARALAELDRVTAPGGRILVTMPYGRPEDHGWFRQFSRVDVEHLLGLVDRPAALEVFAYSSEGWQISDLDSASGAVYRDYTADPSPVDDRAAAARAVACVAFGAR